MKHAVPVVCLKEISLKAQRKMQQDAMRGKWYNLVRLQDIPEFAAWLTDDFHEWWSRARMRGRRSARTSTA